MKLYELKVGMEFYDEMNDCKIVIDEIHGKDRISCDVWDDYLYNGEFGTPRYELHTLNELDELLLMED